MSSDPFLVLLLVILGPVSVCVSALLTYLAFIHITKKYANQVQESVLDKIINAFERKLPDIVETVLTNNRKQHAIAQEDLASKINSGGELLKKLFGGSGLLGNDDEDETPTIPSGLRQRRVIE